MRTHLIVVAAPASENGTSLAKRREQRLVQAFVSETAVEALDKRVLLRFARLSVVPLNAHRLAPSQDRHTVQLGAIVGDAGLRLATARNESIIWSCTKSSDQHALGRSGTGNGVG